MSVSIRQLLRFRLFRALKVTRGCRDPICESLRGSQCHLEPSWTLWQSGVVRHYSSSSCGQEPLTPRQTEGNEKRVRQPKALHFICRETWLILQLCGHSFLNANNIAAECRAGKKRGLCGYKGYHRTSLAEDLEVVTPLNGGEFAWLWTYC